ncbi:type II toxin-antitoxin system RelE family toxin [Jiangella rhizosphaerae]|uniref:Type II toxin-antitoxin system RelE/ParE family toxin n=1 Tax=Jiangella rhizosphaerae TaxID=2293569 RepID=A0A418KIH9_9ACTN|nr:hypothetical protein [Jiangella rhizosphaerae]RIQ13239.1 hypothetical protein DY240_26175 [Jiangella rhizosphaerae]
MPEVAYTLIWTTIAVKDLQKLDHDDAHNVLNNVTLLSREAHPPFSDEAGDGTYFLHIGRVSVAYEVLGFTIRVLAMEPRDT